MTVFNNEEACRQRHHKLGEAMAVNRRDDSSPETEQPAPCREGIPSARADIEELAADTPRFVEPGSPEEAAARAGGPPAFVTTCRLKDVR